MFRPSIPLLKIFRGNMTSKRGNKNFYKGRNVPSMGHIVKGSDKFIIEPKKWAENTFRMPDLSGFRLKPYVALHAPRNGPRPELTINKPKNL